MHSLLAVAASKVVAGTILSRVGSQHWSHAAGFDESFSRHSPGLLCHWLTVKWAVESGGSAYHLLWGDVPYKHRLGAHAQPLYQCVFYSSRRQRALAVRDMFGPALRDAAASRPVQRVRWAVRSRIKRG